MPVPVGKAHAPVPKVEEQILDVASSISPPPPPLIPRSTYRPILPDELELSPASDELPPQDRPALARSLGLGEDELDAQLERRRAEVRAEFDRTLRG